MKQVFLITGLVFVLSCFVGKVEGISCKDCHDVEKPGNCRPSLSCGDGEICSTEEYIDIDGQQAYRLGCANAARCRLFLNAKTIFGKREISPKCYECCETDDCNANLCQSSGGHVTTISPPTEHHTCPPQVIQSSCSSGCPQLFVPFQDKCYYISPARESWLVAKTICRKLESHLVSVNSKEEHGFLNDLVKHINASFVAAYWTGGFYSHEVREFEYTDGSPFSYTHWFPGDPPLTYSRDFLFYVGLKNPVYTYKSNYTDFPMHVYTNFNSNGIICETSNHVKST